MYVMVMSWECLIYKKVSKNVISRGVLHASVPKSELELLEELFVLILVNVWTPSVGELKERIE